MDKDHFSYILCNNSSSQASHSLFFVLYGYVFMHTECDAPGGEAHYNWLSVLAVDMQSRVKIHQAFRLSFCTLQAIKNWSREGLGTRLVKTSLDSTHCME